MIRLLYIIAFLSLCITTWAITPTPTAITKTDIKISKTDVIKVIKLPVYKTCNNGRWGGQPLWENNIRAATHLCAINYLDKNWKNADLQYCEVVIVMSSVKAKLVDGKVKNIEVIYPKAETLVLKKQFDDKIAAEVIK